MKHYEKVRHFGSLILVTVVAILTLSVVVHATQVITTPNAAFSSYSLAAGASSAPITPVAGQAVLVMGTATTSGAQSVGEVTMVHTPLNCLEWTGLESFSGAAITSGCSFGGGTHIVYLDFFHQVDLRVNSATTFVVHNASSFTRTGNVTMIW
jgi:hypothetical protein